MRGTKEVVRGRRRRRAERDTEQEATFCLILVAIYPFKQLHWENLP